VNLLIGAATIGLILAPLAIGVFLSYRIFNTLDLTADGSFGIGAAVAAALLVHGASPVTATALAAVGGAVAGTITGLLATGLLVTPLLAGVLVSTALYSAILFVMGTGNLSIASADNFGALAHRLAERMFGLPDELTLFGTSVAGESIATLGAVILIAVMLVLLLALFLATDLGLALRAAGANGQMARALGIDVDRMLVLGLALANALIAFGGALYAQYQGFATIEMGIGALVMGVACLMLGEAVIGRRPLWRWIAAAAVGALLFRLLVAGAVRAGLNPNALKLLSALFVLAVLVLPRLMRRLVGGAAARAVRSHV
jgi:putative tryptophan/tyrosine transport system permease protein